MIITGFLVFDDDSMKFLLGIFICAGLVSMSHGHVVTKHEKAEKLRDIDVVTEEDKMSAENARNTSEQNLLGLKKLGFDSDIMRSLVLAKVVAEHLRAGIVKNVTDAVEIDRYNKLAEAMNEFINNLVLKISENNHFEDRESRAFYEASTKDWMKIQTFLKEMMEYYGVQLKDETHAAAADLAPEAMALKDKIIFYVKKFTDAGEEAVRDTLAFTLSSMESFITEKKSPVNQQAVIDYLNAQKWNAIGKPVKGDMDHAKGPLAQKRIIEAEAREAAFIKKEEAKATPPAETKPESPKVEAPQQNAKADDKKTDSKLAAALDTSSKSGAGYGITRA